MLIIFLHVRRAILLSIACVISIIIVRLLCQNSIPKQIDLQAFFVTTAALLCQRVVVNRQLHNTNTVIIWHLHKVF